MGGHGSGEKFHKKRTVEECWSLDAAKLFRRGVPGSSVTWTNSRGEQTLAAVCCFDSPLPRHVSGGLYRRTLTLLLKAGPVEDATALGQSSIRLVSTRPNYGGVRWWFVCPLGTCERRVRKLYLPGNEHGVPDGRLFFGCRTCHDLTYRSAQTHDSRVDYLCRNLSALRATVDSGDYSQIFLGFRAYTKLRGWS